MLVMLEIANDFYLLAGSAAGFETLLAFALSDFTPADDWPDGKKLFEFPHGCAPAAAV